MNEYTPVLQRVVKRTTNVTADSSERTKHTLSKKENEPLPKTHQFGVDGERDRGLSRGSFRDRFRQPVVSHARAMMMMMMIKEVGRSDLSLSSVVVINPSYY